MKKRRIRRDTTSFVKLCVKVHGKKYSYEKTVYKTMHDKITITCPEHGDFEQLANHHKKGHGCSQCAFNKQEQRQRDTTAEFIRKAVEKHGDKYDYAKTYYGKNAHERLIITCNEHGSFEQTPNGHLTGSGCRKCGIEITKQKLEGKGGWTRTAWVEKSKGRKAQLYILECWNEEERFYKIGITYKKLERRFCAKASMPYQYSVLKLIESTNPSYIYDLEKKYLRKTKMNKYKPKIQFNGATECREPFSLWILN